jgi:hypothetical protein
MDAKRVEVSKLRFGGLMAVRAAMIDWWLKKVAAEPKE